MNLMIYCFLKVHSRIFNPYGGVTIAIEELRECFGLCWSRSIGMFIVAHLLYRVSYENSAYKVGKLYKNL